MTSVLYIGGSGEISFACVEASIRAGHDVTVFNRGKRGALPDGVAQTIGEFADDAHYAALSERNFDVVCQFIAYTPGSVERDIRTFSGRCGQYVFISTASAYQKPCPVDVITESLPLDNPYWEYSRKKAACEQVLREAADLPVTIVRPSHTYRTRLPGTCVDADHMVWRLRQGKPVIIHDEGESVWTLTHADDFAGAFTGLLGNPSAIDETYHITCESALTWNEIIDHVCAAMKCDPHIVHVPTDTLVAWHRQWLGPLRGDKANSVRFDNSKVRSAVGDWGCQIGLAAGFERAAVFAEARLAAGWSPDPDMDLLLDRIVADA